MMSNRRKHPYIGPKRGQIGGQHPYIGPKRGQIGGQHPYLVQELHVNHVHIINDR